MEYEEAIPIVIDNGSFEIRAGLSGNDRPSQIFRCANSFTKRGRPIKHGQIVDLDWLTDTWTNCLSTMNSLDGQALSFVHHLDLRRESQELVTEVAFECLGANAFYMYFAPATTMYSFGRNGGLILDCGFDRTTVTAIYEGYSLPHTAITSQHCGEFLDKKLAQSLNLNRFDLEERIDIIEGIKKKCCFVQNEVGVGNISPVYTLPDGNKLAVGENSWRYLENMFDTEDLESLPSVALDVIKTCDIDIRSEMYQNMCLSGGSSLFPGMKERFQTTMRNLVRRVFRVDTVAFRDREYGAWLGASISSSLSTHHQLFISKTEYEEFGPGIVLRKCFG